VSDAPQDAADGTAAPGTAAPDTAGSGEAAPQGIDLARSMLARAKADARGRRGGSSGDGGAGAAGTGRDARRRAARRGTEQRSGSGPDDRDPQPMSTAVRRLLADAGWEERAAVGGVLGRWPEIVGADIAAHCIPETFDDGRLVVRADSSAWATQVRLLAPTLLARLSQEVGANVVRSLDVVGPSAPSWRKGKFHISGRGPRDTYG
jgi:predicted nucleic acid-binding Zn ribbon protein